MHTTGNWKGKSFFTVEKESREKREKAQVEI
jgi:hypothetical protein